MRYWISYSLYWGNKLYQPEVKLWFMWKNYFLKTMGYVEKYLKKKLRHKCGILPQINS